MEKAIANTYPLDKAIRIKGEVIKGFGRGRELLGVPTANLPAENYTCELANIENGVYIGFATVNNSSNSNQVYKAVLSIGDNPHFQNKTRTIVCNKRRKVLEKITQQFFF